MIIFQADHGSTYGHNKASRDRDFNWTMLKTADLRILTLYAAYLLPETIFDRRPATIIRSVNTFPLIHEQDLWHRPYPEG